MNTEKLFNRHTVGRCMSVFVAGFLAAGGALAQTWDVSDAITGTNTSPVQNSGNATPWSFHRITGPNCATTLPVALTNPFTTWGTIARGFHGNQPLSGPLPVVHGGYSSSTGYPKATATYAGLTVPANGVLMHPYTGQDECVAVRFSPGAGTYILTGRFYGAYAGMGTGGGNGVLPKIVQRNSGVISLVGAPLNATTSGQQTFSSTVTLSGTSDYVDFAVHNNGSFLSDSTILELRVQKAQTMYPHSVTASTPGPVNTCAPYKLCFDVNVPNGPLGNGSATLNLQVVNNAASPPLIISTQAQTTTVDGQICFQMPALPAGSSYDYVVTTNYTQSVPGVPPLQNQTVLQSPLSGPNNDLVCSNQPASTCCPPVNHGIVAGMFNDDHTNTSTSYHEFFVPSSSAASSFVNGLASYLAYLKFVCPQIVGLKAEFFNGPVAAPLGIGLPAGPLTGPNATSPDATYTSNTWGAASLSPLNAALNAVNTAPRTPGQYYRTSVKITGVNASGQPVNCGFDAVKCAEGDSYGYQHDATAGFKTTGPARPSRTQ